MSMVFISHTGDKVPTPQFTALTVLPPVLKRAIQDDLAIKFPNGVIGARTARREMFDDLNEAICSRYLSLYLSDGEPLAWMSQEAQELTMNELASAAGQYYANRSDHLSVADYVTDFLDIVHMCKDLKVTITK